MHRKEIIAWAITLAVVGAMVPLVLFTDKHLGEDGHMAIYLVLTVGAVNWKCLDAGELDQILARDDAGRAAGVQGIETLVEAEHVAATDASSERGDK